MANKLKLTNCTVIRLTDAQSKMPDMLKDEVLQNLKRSQIMQIILEAIYAKNHECWYLNSSLKL